MFKRDCTFDIARVISMLYIIAAWHLANYTDYLSLAPYGEFVTNGALGLFFFISAYLLGRKYKVNNLYETAIFYKKRLIRIMPLFLVSLLTFVIIGTITFKTAILGAFGLTTFIPPQIKTLWFVSMILVFYIIFPIISRPNIYFQILFSVILYITLFIIESLYGCIDVRFFYYFPCFVLGVILSRFEQNKFINVKIFISEVLLFCISTYILSNLEINRGITFILIFIVAISGAGLILSLSKVLSKVKIFNKLVAPLSYASMAAYMFHRQVYLVLMFTYWPNDGLQRVVYLYLVAVPLILLVGYLIQYVHDRVLDKCICKMKIKL